MDYNEIIYQIYPLGFCGCPSKNDEKPSHRILHVLDWVSYLKQLGITTVLFNPVFESESHGYDTRDFSLIDIRLGTNEDFALVCDTLHEHGIKVILDGVFNHVGRSFPFFQDALKNGPESRYADWFFLHFGRKKITYDNWEGHNELVKLNLDNPEVVRFLFDRVDQWIAEFGIDGLRLDTAHILSRNFLKQLRSYTDRYHDFFIVGESTAGSYHDLLLSMDSVTNYEIREVFFQSFNHRDLIPLIDSISRQFSYQGVYAGCHLLNFLDNHDINRIASVLKKKKELPLMYALLYALPGIPCLYYGSEWGTEGKKKGWSDQPLRPFFEDPQLNSLSRFITQLNLIRRNYPVFSNGDYVEIYSSNEQFVFRRRNASGQLTFALNIADHAETIHFDSEVAQGIDLLQKKTTHFSQEMLLEAETVYLWYTDW